MKKIFRDIFLYFVLITFMSISNTFAASSDSSSNNFVKSTDYYAAKDFIAKGSYEEAIAILKELEKEESKMEIATRFISAVIALETAIKELGVTKTISFHHFFEITVINYHAIFNNINNITSFNCVVSVRYNNCSFV